MNSDSYQTCLINPDQTQVIFLSVSLDLLGVFAILNGGKRGILKFVSALGSAGS